MMKESGADQVRTYDYDHTYKSAQKAIHGDAAGTGIAEDSSKLFTYSVPPIIKPYNFDSSYHGLQHSFQSSAFSKVNSVTIDD